MSLCKFTSRKRLTGPVFTVSNDGKTCILKAHEAAYQNHIFPTELNARIKLGSAAHVTKMVGVVTHDSSIDGTCYVHGIVLEHCSKGDLRSLLKNSDPPVELSRKYRWAAQIVHGLLTIHQAGLLHGDLRCQNVVVDGCDDAQLIDLTNGKGFTEGWNSV